MDVRELIKELLEFNPNAKVELYVDSQEESDDFEFGLQEFQRPSGDVLTIEVDLDKYVMIDKRDYENLKTELENLEEDLAEANQELEYFKDER